MAVLRTRIDHSSQQALIPPWWDELLVAAGNGSAFLSRPWLQTWLDVYGPAFQAVWVSFWSGERCVAGFVFQHRRGFAGPFPVRLATLNTAAEDAEESPWIEYNDVLCVAGFEEDVGTACLEVIGTLGWDQLYLNGYPEQGVLARIAAQAGRWRAETEWKVARFADLSALGPQGIDGILSSNTRSQIRRSLKLYGARGDTAVHEAGGVAEAHQFLDDLARLHRDGWQRRGKEGGFRTPQFVTFHKRLIEKMWPHGVSLLCARAGDTAFAYLYNFVHAGHVYFYQSGFAYEEDAKLKPGLAAHYLAMHHFLKRGMHEYDFMAGDSRYKQSLANGERKLGWTRIERANVVTAAMHAARSLRRRVRSIVGRSSEPAGAEAQD